MSLVDKEYVQGVLEHSFVKTRKKGCNLQLREEEFLNMLEGKLGPATVVKRIFTVFDSSQRGHLDPKEFFSGISAIVHGKPEAKLNCE